jgi:hypothetical protein
MPTGRYVLRDLHDDTPLGDERFSCAPGPSGWRYVSTTCASDGTPDGSVDLTLDSLGRPVRLQLRAGAWQVRGALVDGISWVRTPLDADPDTTAENTTDGTVRAHAFTGRSPVFALAAARMLRAAPGGLRPGAATRLRLVALAHPVLAARTIDQGWTYEGSESHPTDTGPLVVERYTVADLETGEQSTLHIAGDVLLAGPGIELEELDTPPTPAV